MTEPIQLCLATSPRCIRLEPPHLLARQAALFFIIYLIYDQLTAQKPASMLLLSIWTISWFLQKKYIYIFIYGGGGGGGGCRGGGDGGTWGGSWIMIDVWSTSSSMMVAEVAEAQEVSESADELLVVVVVSSWSVQSLVLLL